MTGFDYSEDDIAAAFAEPSYERGKAYFDKRKVLRWQIEGSGDAALLRAQVSGNGPQPYELWVQPTRSKSGRVRFKNECSCPLGGGCKHAVAALLAARSAAQDAEGDTPITPIAATLAKLETQGKSRAEVLAVLTEAAARHGVTLLPAASVKAKPAPLPAELDHWLHSVSRASQGPRPNASQCLLYQLESLAGEPMGVQVLHARILKTGGYTAAKPYGNLELAQYNPPAYFAEADTVIVRDLIRMARQGVSYTGRLGGIEGAHALGVMLETGRTFVGDELALDKAAWLTRGAAREGSWIWQARDDGAQQLRLATAPAASHIIATAPPFYVDVASGSCGEVSLSIAPKLAAALAAAPAVPAMHAAEFAQKLAEMAPANAVPPPPHVQIHTIGNARPAPVLWLYGEEPHLGYGRARAERYGAARVSFDYEGLRVRAKASQPQVSRRADEGVRQIVRNKAEEEQRLAELKRLTPLRGVPAAYRPWEAPHIDPDDLAIPGANPEEAWQQFQQEHIPRLKELGWLVETDLSFPFRFVEAQSWYGEIAEGSSSDWFGVELGVLVNGERVNLLPILLAALRGDIEHLKAVSKGEVAQFTARLPDGRRIILPAARLQPLVAALLEMAEGAELEDGKLRLSAFEAARLVDFENANPELAGRWLGGEKRLAMGRALADMEGIAEVWPPGGLLATLRPYQQAGLNWLQFLRAQNLAGILADDMGLGKTVQTLAHLLLEKEQGRLKKPTLILAPTSLMGNWRREAEKFTPGLKILTLHGAARKEKFGQIKDVDVVLSTYALLRFDEDVLTAQRWQFVILDEAQNIKNAGSATAKVARGLTAQHRLCLTGTPLENHLGELWSQYHFLMPGLLGTDKEFKRLYRLPIEKQNDEDRRARLSRRIAPFLLRRTKGQVAKDLPPKTEIIRSVALEGAQRDLYETVRLSLNEKVRNEMMNLGLKRSHFVVLEALLKLRQVCCDPRLVKLDAAVKAHGSSAKLDLLMEMLLTMLEEGRKVLLFSQFTSMLALIEERLHAAGLAYAKLTGDTVHRDEEVNRFQSGEVPLFLLSLKAGGVGLNLTAADTVIHYDPWWNPAAENQATDRAHRIGQDKPVFVYKLLVEGSVEERIQALQARKAALFNAVVGGAETELAARLDEDDIAELLRPLA